MEEPEFFTGPTNPNGGTVPRLCADYSGDWCRKPGREKSAADHSSLHIHTGLINDHINNRFPAEASAAL